MKLSEPKLLNSAFQYEIEVEINGKIALFLVTEQRIYNFIYVNPNKPIIGYFQKTREIRFKTSEKRAIRKAIEEKINNLKK